MLPTKKELVDISIEVDKINREKIRLQMEAAKKAEQERRCKIAQELFATLPDKMREAANKGRFEVIINCGDNPSSQEIAAMIDYLVGLEHAEGIKTRVFRKFEIVSNVGFGVSCDEPDTKEITYWAFRIYW